jgi:L-methionine (R)-S-oxide reductase
MPESLHITENSTKEQKYTELLPQVKALLEGEFNLYANLANVSATLKEVFKFWWVGFYLVDTQNPQELVLGPFQVFEQRLENIFIIMFYKSDTF